MKRMVCLVCAVVLGTFTLTSLSAKARARRRRRRSRRSKRSFKLLGTFPTKLKTTSPSFFNHSTRPLVDRGRLLAYGSGIWREEPTFYFIDLKTAKTTSVTAPVYAYVKAQRKLFPTGLGTGRVAPVKVGHLAAYDKKNKEGYVVVWERRKDTSGQRRYYLLHWDLGSNRIRAAYSLGTRTSAHRWFSIKPIGYDPASKEVFLQRVIKLRSPQGKRAYSVSVIAAKGGRGRVVKTFYTQRKLSPGPFYDAKNKRAFLVEYAEKADTKPAPWGYLVDLQKGKVKKIRIPLTSYAVSFSSDGKWLYVFSAQTGWIWKVDTKSGRRRRRRKVGTLGHTMGYIRGDTLLLLKNYGLMFLDPKTLRKIQYVRAKKLPKSLPYYHGVLVSEDHFIVDYRRILYLFKINTK